MTKMNLPAALHEILSGRDLSAAGMQAVMRAIMRGEATPAQIGGLLVALRLKGESVTEITAAARVMRELASRVEVDTAGLVDTCGTGGDGTNSFNISTTAAFVAAASGARVAKHGNRAVSGKSGSADVLAAAGVNLELNPAQIADCIETVNIGFMFAPLHHGAMKYALGPRRELGVRTLFNVLGPLTNPAGAPNQVIGVYSRAWLKPLAETLRQLGARHVLIVHAEDGMDEISIAGRTWISELKDGRLAHYSVTPEEFGIKPQDTGPLAVKDAEQSLALLGAVLDNRKGAARDIVCLNAGAAIYAAGRADSIHDGVTRAAELIDSGAARQKLQQLIAHSQSCKP